MTPEDRRSLYIGAFLGTFFLLLLLGGSATPYNDGKKIFSQAENIVYEGHIGIETEPGVRYYNPRPLLVSLVHVPGVLLRRGLGALFPAAEVQIRLLTSHLAPAALAAVTCVLFLRFVLALGIGAAAASLATLVLIFGTMLFVYSRVVWSEIVQATAFWGLFSELLLGVRNPTRRAALKVGVWAGLLLSSKYVFIVALPGAALFAGAQLWKRIDLREARRLLGWVVLGTLPFGLLIAWFNLIRNGTIFHAGYSNEPFHESIFWGLHGLFFSLGKGFFLYNPPLVFAFRNDPKLPRHWWWALVAVAGPVVLVYAKYSNWAGDWSWGPRYLVFLIPPLMVPVAVFIDGLLQQGKRILLGLFGGVAAAGAIVALLGAGMYWDFYIRLSQAARTEWLGNPDRRGAYSEIRDGRCDPCFEDLYGHTYLPAFGPIEGHYWLLKHAIKKDSWEVAVADAPWRRYTSLQLEATRGTYPWPAIDFWLLRFHGPFAAAGRVLLALFLVGALGGGALWAAAVRRPAPTSS